MCVGLGVRTVAWEADCTLCSSPQAAARVSLSPSRGVCWHRIPHNSVNLSVGYMCGILHLNARFSHQPGVPPFLLSQPLLCQSIYRNQVPQVLEQHQYDEGGDAPTSPSSAGTTVPDVAGRKYVVTGLSVWREGTRIEYFPDVFHNNN